MRLSGIKLAGFKSFVDPTQLPLPANLTGVVGPNGCGKSNIIDAVRWVLGESSMKQLRGQESEDVIFNGSKSRKPVGRASVELSFDNSDGQITGPYAAYTEIAVRRELTRDGNSQYFLNGRKCLKRDVTDLFLGTGLGGKHQYAIMEQGMVSRMIEAKPEELRNQLEEAAGISRYKERRRETESRIKQTRENLSRLNDLRSEIQQRLEVLRKQAANAEKYKEFKEQERTLKAEILALRERQLGLQAEAHETEIEELARGAELSRAGVTEAEAARTGAEQGQRDAQAVLSTEQTKVYEAEGQLARLEQDLNHARELKTLKLRELDQITRQLAELDRRAQSEQARMENLQRELQGLESQAETAQRNEQEAQQGLAKSEEDLHTEQARWDQFQTRSEEPLFQTEGERVRVQGLERAQFQIEERYKRLAAEQGTLDATPIQASLFDADAELERLNADLEAAQSRLQALDRELQAIRDQRSALESTLHESRQALQSARGRLSSLETLQQAALRQDDAELNGWLRQNQLQELPRLAQSLSVDAGWEAAVEHVLQGLLQAPLLPLLHQRAAALQNAPKAGTALFDAAGGDGIALAGTLAAHAQGPAAVTEFLGSVRCAANASEAQLLVSGLAAGESVITPDGVWRGRNWLRYPRTEAGGSGVIAREALLKQLKLQIEEHTRLVTEGEHQLADLRNRQQQFDVERRDTSQRFEQFRSRQASRMAFRQAQAVRLEQTQARIAALVQDIDALKAQREQQQRELAESREKLLNLEAIANQLREERNQLQQSLARARDAVNRARVALTQAAQARNQVQINLAGRQSALSALAQTLHDLGEGRELMVHNLAGRQKEAEELDAPLTEQSGDVDGARAAVADAREGLRLARERLGACEQALAASAQNLRNAEFAKDAASEKLQQARLEFENLRARREVVAQQIVETGIEREALFGGLPEDATLEAWEEKLASIARRIDRLGAINLAAIQELEEAAGRDKYLGEQYTDLHNALETLEQAIRQIDAETKERFKATFDQVDTIFRDRFPRLFGGGEAYLELTGDDLLDTGVRVMARPPGKRNSSIQMLSGGEKAMTAVALLLALFQLNPAPFCLMDEVDAPLDDANVARYCEVVREMSHTVQFIIITHNKITMELASHLHGVTMQEPGVSRLVSVDVAQAVELAGEPEPKAEA